MSDERKHSYAPMFWWSAFAVAALVRAAFDLGVDAALYGFTIFVGAFFAGLVASPERTGEKR